MNQRVGEVILRYPDTNHIMAEGSLDAHGKMNGLFRIYDNNANKHLIKRMTFMSGKLVSSELILGDKSIKMNIAENNVNATFIKAMADKIKFLGLKIVNKDTVFDGTSTEIITDHFCLVSQLTQSSNGDVKNITLVEVKTNENNVLRLNYREVGEGGKILDVGLFNHSNIEIARKTFKDGNDLKPLFLELKNINEDVISGTYKGGQIPSLGIVRDLN